MKLKLDCGECRKTTVIDDAECKRIRAELARSGVGAATIIECACGRFQFVLRLVPEKPKWNLAATGSR